MRMSECLEGDRHGKGGISCPFMCPSYYMSLTCGTHVPGMLRSVIHLRALSIPRRAFQQRPLRLAFTAQCCL